MYSFYMIIKSFFDIHITKKMPIFIERIRYQKIDISILSVDVDLNFHIVHHSTSLSFCCLDTTYCSW